MITSIEHVGKNLDLGASFKKYSESKISEVFLKYSAKVISYKTTLEKKTIYIRLN